MTTETTSPPVQAAATGRGYFWAGIAIFVLGVTVAVVQYAVLKLLIEPWYLPASATIAAVLLLCSLAQRRTVTRIIALVLLTALAGFEWLMLTTWTALPDYAGPHRGAKFPPFQTVRADGRSFSDKDLQDGKPHVLVLFRGRW
jgi:hypothetical protein